MELKTIEHGGVTSAQGFLAAGVHAGFKKDPEALDLAMVESYNPCTVAAVFTKNKFASAPVRVNRKNLGSLEAGVAQAVLINSGNANAATGQEGVDKAMKVRKLAAEAVGCTDDDVLLASTGVIGEQLNTEPFTVAVPELVQKLSPDEKGGHDAACAIMTTDTHPKECAVSYTDDDMGVTVTVGGMVKGAGMIQPNMATMICVITSDLSVSQDAAREALVSAVGNSFNKVTVDSDTSTSDTCILMANGKACPNYTLPVKAGSPSAKLFSQAVGHVAQTLARAIAADGEGASKLVTVNVKGAEDDADADAAARAIANSPLVKTAIAGHDANWGRVVAALGKSSARFDSSQVDVDMMGIPVMRGGMATGFDEDKAKQAFEAPEVVLDVDLHAGDAQTTVWTCDLTHGYIDINADYRS